ncbi:MAG: hypothetical protein ABSC23_21280 [Bryobacteraceae bacterium]|jgi:nicotinamidase-related amidase
MYRRSFLVILPGVVGMAAAQTPQPEEEWRLNRPKVPGTLSLRASRRVEQPAGSGKFRASEEVLRWEVAQTAVIICDVWDNDNCLTEVQRNRIMAPQIDQVASAARNLGVMIFHCPSDTMKYYEGRPERLRMQRAPMVPSPIPIRSTPQDPDPLLRGGCGDPIYKRFIGPGPATTRGNYPWEREYPAIDIAGYDGISDSGQEIYNYCKQEGITNLAIMGVHTNECILNRSFGIRMMTRLGFNMVLVRDLSDSGYVSSRSPFVSHTRGSELIVEYIEAHWCPSILSEDLTRVIPGSDGPVGDAR